MSKLHHNSTSHLSGSKRTWECHRGCLQFCLPSCKKSCCKPGAKDFTSTMIDQIEKFQGEMKGVAEARHEIDDDSEEIQPFACGQFCSPECSPSCTIGCCTEMVPKDDTNTPKHSSYGVARALHALHQKQPQAPEPVPAPKIQDIQRMLEMPCGDGCSAHCSPACSTDCCNSYGEGKQNMGGTQRQVITTTNNLPTTSKQHGNVMDMYKKAISTCHVDCEKLCLPACEFVCCVPSKMREIRFTKDVEMRFGLRKTLD